MYQPLGIVSGPATKASVLWCGACIRGCLEELIRMVTICGVIPCPIEFGSMNGAPRNDPLAGTTVCDL